MRGGGATLAACSPLKQGGCRLKKFGKPLSINDLRIRSGALCPLLVTGACHTYAGSVLCCRSTQERVAGGFVGGGRTRSSCVESQGVATAGARHGVLVFRMALSIVSKRRMHATFATFIGLPAARSAA